MYIITQPDINRFFSKVNLPEYIGTDECWIWKASLRGRGYGWFWLNGFGIMAHRFAYEAFVGVIADKLCVLHHCDNPMCVNPAHLFVGTFADNNADKAKKGRCVQGEKHPSSKLYETDVLKIRKLYESGEYSERCLATAFGVSSTTIHSIIKHRIWKHID